MAAGVTRAVFFYLQTDCSSFNAGQCDVSTAQSFTVGLYSGRPSSSLVVSQAFSVTVQETIAAQSNTASTVVTSSNDPELGMLLTITVTGATGTIGSAKAFYDTPQSDVDFCADVFRLYSTSVTFSGGNTGTYTNQLLVPSGADVNAADKTGTPLAWAIRTGHTDIANLLRQRGGHEWTNSTIEIRPLHSEPRSMSENVDFSPIEATPSNNRSRASQSVGELMMRSVGLGEFDGCGMARSRSESTIPCN
jgi:hypothetical protein